MIFWLGMAQDNTSKVNVSFTQCQSSCTVKVLHDDPCLQIQADYRSVKRVDYVAVEIAEAVVEHVLELKHVDWGVLGECFVLNVCEIPGGCMFLFKFLRGP